MSRLPNYDVSYCGIKAMIRGLIIACLLWLSDVSASAALAETDPVSLARILPQTVYAEEKQGRTRLNFDFELHNTGKEDAVLTYIELRAFDQGGNIISRQQLGGNGSPGPIEMLADKTIPAGGSLYVFNPFPDLPVTSGVTAIKLRIFHTLGSIETQIPVSHSDAPSLTQPPLTERAYIFSGSDILSHHRRVSLNSDAAKSFGMDKVTQRFAIDLTVLDPVTGDIGTEPYEKLENWPGFGQKIVSPVRGTIMEMRATMPDNTMSASGQRVFPDSFDSYGETAGLGNYVIIKIDDDHFLMMAHFRQGTLTAAVGDQIEPGQYLGELGLSGDTAYPHLHIQMQDGADTLQSQPIPIRFDCANIGTKTSNADREDVSPHTGQMIAPCNN